MMMTGGTGTGSGGGAGAGGGASGGDVEALAVEGGGEEAAGAPHPPSRQFGLARLWADNADHMKTALEALCMGGQVRVTNDNTLLYSI